MLRATPVKNLPASPSYTPTYSPSPCTQGEGRGEGAFRSPDTPHKNQKNTHHENRESRSHPIPILLIALFIATFNPAARAREWNLTDSQFHTTRVDISAMDANGLTLAPSPVSRIDHLSWDQCLEISQSTDPVPPAQGRFDLYLVGGDRISGDPIAIEGNLLHWHSARLDLTDFPLSSARAIARSGTLPPGLEDPRTDDVVRLANGDIAHGVVTQITSEGVTLQSGDATPTLGWDTIAAVEFSTPPDAAAQKPKRLFRVHFSGEESIVVPNFSLADDQITLQMNPTTSRAIDASIVTRIEQLDGPVSWVSTRAPAENTYKPFLGENFPARFDRTVADDKPISEKFPPFHHGIGCHSYNRLTYNLDGKFAAFRTQFAIDSDSPLADVTVRIYLDDKPVFEKKNVRAGPVYPLVMLPLADSKTLSLEVDYGENYATADRFAWLDPALVRDAPPALPPTTPATHP